MKYLIFFEKNILPICIVIIVGLWLMHPLFAPGFYPMHDNTQPTRVYEMYLSLRDGLFPVRWVQDLGYGYGYPIFNFYAPLAYYVGGVTMLLGLTTIAATKVMIGIGFVLSGISMYFLAKSFWGKVGGGVAAICYLCAPYHALDTYVRGDVAEVFAYAFLPLAWYGLWQTYKTGKWKFVIWGAIGFAGVIISHNLTAFMLSPFFFLVSFLLIIKKQKTLARRILPLLIPFIGILLSGFYWIPVFMEMHFTNVLSQIGGGADYSRNFVCLSQLWSSDWGFGGSIPGCIDGISFALGKLYILLLLAVILLLPFMYKKKKEVGIVISFVLIFLFFSIFMQLQTSQPIWKVISPMAILQYPWRFLLLCAFFMSFLSGSIFWLLGQIKYGKAIVIILAIIIVGGLLYQEGRYFRPQYMYATDGSIFTNRQNIEWNISKISDEYMPKDFQKPKNEKGIPKQLLASFSGRVRVVKNTTKEKILTISSDRNQTSLVNIAFFPTWSAYVDTKKVPLSSSPHGMNLTIPQGQHIIRLQFSQTTSEWVGNALSLAGVVILIIGIITL